MASDSCHAFPGLLPHERQALQIITNTNIWLCLLSFNITESILHVLGSCQPPYLRAHQSSFYSYSTPPANPEVPSSYAIFPKLEWHNVKKER